MVLPLLISQGSVPGPLDPLVKKTSIFNFYHSITGEATILQEYIVTTKHKDKNVSVCVAGCRCLSGNLDRKNKFRILRNKETIYEGIITSADFVKR